MNGIDQTVVDVVNRVHERQTQEVKLGGKDSGQGGSLVFRGDL